MSLEDDIRVSMGITITLVILVIAAVSLRLYVRTLVKRAYCWDDTLLLISTALFLVMAGLALELDSIGDITYASVSTQISYYKYFTFSTIFYLACTAFVKLSLCVFLHRLAVKAYHHYIIYGIALVTSVTGIVFTFLLIFNCKPVQYQWDKTIEGGTCHTADDYYDVTLANAILLTVTDVVLSLLPVWIIWDVKMQTRDKVSVLGIMGLGLLSTAATIARISYLKPVIKGSHYTSDDIWFGMWSIIEPAVAIIAASMTALRSLLRSIVKRFYSTQTEITGTTQSGSAGNQSESSEAKWSFQKPRDAGHIRSYKEARHGDISLPEVDLRTSRNISDTKTIVKLPTNNSSLEMLTPDVEKGWGVTRTDRWSISEELFESQEKRAVVEPPHPSWI